MICPNCSQDTAREIKTIRAVKSDENDYVVIDNVPMITCKNCGESFLTPDTLSKISDFKSHPEKAVEKTMRFASL